MIDQAKMLMLDYARIPLSSPNTGDSLLFFNPVWCVGHQPQTYRHDAGQHILPLAS